MTVLDLSVDELLTTTRAVRKRLDLNRPVEISLVKECLELALQAPSGSNSQNWHFLILTDFNKKQRIAEYYRRSWHGYAQSTGAAHRLHQDDPVRGPTQKRVFDSAEYLAENLEKVPVFLIPSIAGRVEDAGASNATQAGTYGSIIPAIWSFMLAARSRGLATCWTSLHLPYEREVAEILGIPFHEVTQVALIPVAYAKGIQFKAAARKPLQEVLHLEAW